MYWQSALGRVFQTQQRWRALLLAKPRREGERGVSPTGLRRQLILPASIWLAHSYCHSCWLKGSSKSREEIQHSLHERVTPQLSACFCPSHNYKVGCPEIRELFITTTTTTSAGFLPSANFLTLTPIFISQTNDPIIWINLLPSYFG